MTFTNEAQAIATQLQQNRDYLEMFDANEEPGLVEALKSSIADNKRQLANLGIFAA